MAPLFVYFIQQTSVPSAPGWHVQKSPRLCQASTRQRPEEREAPRHGVHMWDGPSLARPTSMDRTMTKVYARVLIVDDDQAVREMFAQLLRREGHSVRTAGDAAAALEEVACWHPDAILLDYRMPLINGM